MGTQSSKTEGCQLNPMGWILEDHPSPIMYIGPTQSQVSKIARPKGRFDQMIAGVPELQARVDPREQRTWERYIAGVQVLFGWAGSESEIASSPARFVFVDEFDKMAADVIEAARSRIKTYFGGCVVVVSSPTLEGASPIDDQFEEGTRERWHLQCPHCSDWFYPRLALLRWPQDSRGEELRRGTRLACAACGGELTDRERRRAPARFCPTDKSDEGPDARLDIAPALAHRSFSVSGICTWAQPIGKTAEIYARALRSHDQERIMRATNEQGGEPFRVKGDSPGWRAVWALREGYTRPPDAAFVTIGADPAGDRIDYVVRAWGHQAESWLLEHGTLRGDTLLDQVFLDFQGLVRRDWLGLPVRLALVDSGYRPAGVYAAARRDPLISPSKGHATGDLRYWDRLVDKDERGKVIKVGVRLWHINVGYWAAWLYGRIRWTPGAPGAWHVHDQISEDFARQVTNEQMVQTASGGVAWVKTGNRSNHFGDCERLAAAAAYIENVESLPPPGLPPPERKRPKVSSAFQRRGP